MNLLYAIGREEKQSYFLDCSFYVSISSHDGHSQTHLVLINHSFPAGLGPLPMKPKQHPHLNMEVPLVCSLGSLVLNFKYLINLRLHKDPSSHPSSSNDSFIFRACLILKNACARWWEKEREKSDAT